MFQIRNQVTIRLNRAPNVFYPTSKSSRQPAKGTQSNRLCPLSYTFGTMQMQKLVKWGFKSRFRSCTFMPVFIFSMATFYNPPAYLAIRHQPSASRKYDFGFRCHTVSRNESREPMHCSLLDLLPETSQAWKSLISSLTLQTTQLLVWRVHSNSS